MNERSLASGPYLDLVVSVALTLAVALLTVVHRPVPLESALRPLVGLPFLLLVPGYAVSTAVYPRTTVDSLRDDSTAISAVRDGAITGVERVVLSVTGSLALVGAVSLTANATPWGIRAEPVVAGLTGITLVSVSVAVYRRQSVDPADCPSLVAAVGGTASAFRSEFPAGSVGGTALNAVVVVALVAALAGVGYAAYERPTAERYSEYAVLAGNESGELGPSGYPSELTGGEPTELAVYLENHEGQRTNYTVVTQLERVSSPDSSPTVTESAELDRLHVPVANERSRTVRQTVSPTLTGDDLRLTYLFYAGDAPRDPARVNSDEALQLWVNVSAPGNESAARLAR